jgi:methylglutaconyl-CoA hydratase
MSYETVLVDRAPGGVATLTLNRPDKHNALNRQMIADLTAAAAELADDPAIRAVILTGAGNSFCAGGDLGWMRAQIDADRGTRIAAALDLARMLRALDTLPKPLVGRLHGNAFGGGVGHACVCDVNIGTTDVLMGLTETRLGLIPATIGPSVAARIGPAKARAVFMSGQRFDAAEALRLGLLTRCVPATDLDAAVEAEVTPYLACAPGAVAEAKALLCGFAPPIDDALLARTAAALARRWDSAEAAEGIDAFFQKRTPGWRSG